MTIKFQNADQIEQFVNFTQSMDSDVFIKHGRLQLDGRSPMGMMTVPLNYPMTVEVVEKTGEEEIMRFIVMCENIGILDKRD